MRWPRAALLTRAFCWRTAKSCGPDASTPASSLREAIFASDGDKKALSPGRVRHKPLNHCAGKAGLLPLNLYARVRFFAQFCTRDRGCSTHPAFPAPSFGRKVLAKLERNAPRDRGVVFIAGSPAFDM